MPLTTDERRARQREWSRRYNQKPEAKAKARERARRHRASPKGQRDYKLSTARRGDRPTTR